EALEPRRVDECRRTAILRRQIRVVAEPGDAGPARVDSAPALRAGDAKLESDSPRGGDGVAEILARLERPDGEDVLARRARTVGTEHAVDTGIGDVNPVARDAERAH